MRIFPLARMCAGFPAFILILFVHFYVSLSLRASRSEDDVLLLPAVRVWGERADGLRLSASADYDVLSDEQLSASGARTLDEALAAGVTGVRVERSGGRERSGSARIRGMGDARVLILVDGAPLAGGALPDIPVAEIERVEIVRGASSARYGDRALGGVINIVTKKDDQNDLILNFGYASFATRSASVFFNRKLGGEESRNRLAASASAEKSGGGWLFPGQLREAPDGETTLGGKKVEALNTGYTAYRGRAHFTGENAHGARFTLGGEYAARDAGVPGTIDFPTARAASRDQALRFSAGFAAPPSLAASGDRLNISGAWSWRKRSYRDFSLHETESMNALSHAMLGGTYKIPLSIFNKAEAVGDQDDPSNWTQETANDGAFLPDTNSAGGGSAFDSGENFAHLHFGVQAEYLAFETEHSWERSSFGAPARFVGAFFADGEAGISDFIFSLALRADYHGSHGAFLSPSAGAVWAFREDWRLSINANTAYRVPSFEELFWPEGAFAVGNSDLRSERAVSGDCSLTWQMAANASARLTAFAQGYDDLILWQPSVGGVWRPVNVAKVFARGIEASFEGEAALSDVFTFSWSAEYSFQISEDTSLDQARSLPRVPKEKGSARLGLRLLDRAALSMQGSYTGFRYLNRANTKYLDGYFLLDSALDIRFAPWAKIKFAVHNIFDTAYVHLREYPVSGREWLVSLEVRL